MTTIVLTGATSGIGRATALALADRADRLIVHGPLAAADVRPLMDRLRAASYAEVRYLRADFDELAAVERDPRRTRLAVVQHQQDFALAQVREQPVVGRRRGLAVQQCRRDRVEHAAVAGDRGELDQPDTVAEAAAQAVLEFAGGPRLAHATRPGQGDQAPFAEQPPGGAEIRVAPEQGTDRVRQVAARLDGRFGLVPQDFQVQRGRAGAGGGAQFVRQPPPQVAEDGERFRPASAAAQGEHQQLREPFPQRVFRDEPGELRHQFPVPAQRQFRVEHGVQRGQAELLEPDPPRLGEVVADRLPPPRQPLAQHGDRSGRIAPPRQLASRFAGIGEHVGVDLAGPGEQPVAPRSETSRGSGNAARNFAICTCSALTGSFADRPVANNRLGDTASGRETSSIARMARALAPGNHRAVTGVMFHRVVGPNRNVAPL